jgi:hypothetical protein
MLERVGNNIVASRLLVLQTKRILLTRARANTTDDIDIERYAGAVRTAHERYNQAVLEWGSASSDQYVLVAFTSLIAKAELLHAKLQSASDELPAPDSGQLAIEARALETIIGRWRGIARRSMSAAVA